MNIRTDCRQYRVDLPCAPHKLNGIRCGSCTEYAALKERIVIVKLAALGDVLRTTCLLPVLKDRYPDSHITWVTKSNAAELLAANPLIDRILTIESNYLEVILSEDFDIAIGPDTDSLSASIMTLITSARKRGFVSDRRGGVTPLNEAAINWWRLGQDDTAKRGNRMSYGQWIYAIAEITAPVARPVLAIEPDLFAQISASLDAVAPWAGRWICINTGASGRWREKSWKARHYIELVRLLCQAEPKTAIVLVGGPGEEEMNRDLLKSCPLMIDGGTRASMQKFAAVIQKADLLLTPDSLGYHMGCAVGTPAVCLVGPTSPWELDLYGTNEILHTDLDCISCYRRECPFAVTCMDLLSPEIVLAHLLAERMPGDARSSLALLPLYRHLATPAQLSREQSV